MTVLIVQSRLASTRLNEKALLPLGGKPILSWVLSAMKKVSADRYFLATDESSAEKLFPIAYENGFECFTGPLEDVLKRFCLLIEKTGADTVIRVTGDNPFLFYESVASLTTEFSKQNCDYLTWTGLPHGSGAEIFSGKTLLDAAKRTTETYDHEHVGPAIAAYPNCYRVVKIPAPPEWNFPQYRTTIDTLQDYEDAKHLVRAVAKKRLATGFSVPKIFSEPFSAVEITEACTLLEKKILFVPSVKKGRGTGHLRRCVSLADSLCADVYLPEYADLSGISDLTKPLDDFQIRQKLPQKDEYSLIVGDAFSLEKPIAAALCAQAPLVSIDDGAAETGYCDYLLDIIPTAEYKRKPNLFKSSFIPLPKNRRENPKKIEKILIVIGGEDPSCLTLLTAAVFNTFGLSVTAVVSDPKTAETVAGVRFVKPIENLAEKLYLYDLVVTHYGFTAFEAVAAGCAILLVGTSALHIKLSKYAGFTVLLPQNITPLEIGRLLKKNSRLFPRSRVLAGIRNDTEKLRDFIKKLSYGTRIPCPLCLKKYGAKNLTQLSGQTETFAGMTEMFFPPDSVVKRTLFRTFRRCRSCGIVYLSWSGEGAKQYPESYFFEEYKNQYGKTYLDDFTSIKAQGVRRNAVIDALFFNTTSKRVPENVIPTVLDVGCAYGPFLSAASDAGWQPYGTDISAEAITYVKNTLGFPAVCTRFPDFDAKTEFGVGQFDALTMWFVIEHFKNLDAVLKAVSSLVKTGGIFAFSTPSASGISGRFRRTKFFQNSPSDHYTLWQPQRVASILSRYGFRVKKIISTGQHPERLPFIKKNRLKPESSVYKLLSILSKFFALGDTFEVYCVRSNHDL